MGNRSEVTTVGPEAQRVETVSEDTNITKYVVVRDGYRVSDKDYESPNDPLCLAEAEFWTRVSVNHSYGEKVKITIYDSKEHRVW